MGTTQEPLSKYLAPKLNEARLARQYDAIKARARPGSFAARRTWLPVAFTFAAMAAVLAIFVARRAPPGASLSDGTVLESPADRALPAVALNDGSRVGLGAGSRMRLTSTRADAIRLELERGRVDVAATHREGRSFVVAAHGYEVQVVGTRFVVEILADARVDVRVDEGRVQVRSPSGEVRAVSGGESWSAKSEPVVEDADAAPETLDEMDDVDDDASAATTAGAPGRRGPRRSTTAASSAAKALLDDAQRATAEGRMKDAAQLFDALRHQHRRDPRAALAAFELGRIRLDSLGDPAGAEEALRDALRLAHVGPLREDAEARRVEALDKMGSPACARARDEYLTRHPSGVHRAAVSGRCPAR
jgi:hypothetical protein